eukprot:TRINITY_DN17286_c0_g2_i1.p1 TRINITY_DN17286_c0_g2~~TRINITY_DN17286_c0_g2_i1.p1  ORF type:complete len:406 (+),score=131.14 TRINITY_DN17286_c0_g2_i1:116-1219(+)
MAACRVQRRCVSRTAALREMSYQRPILKGGPVPTGEVLNQYNPANSVVGAKPWGSARTAEQHKEFLLRHRARVGDMPNPTIPMNWRKRDLVPKENEHNPDAFFYEHYVNGGRAFQQVFAEDVLRLVEFPEEGIQIVDVRSNAAKLTHYVPFSVRIPHEELDSALQLPDSAFFKMYAFHKPRVGCEIVCISHDGVASEKALQAFERWGHPHYCLFNFRGGTNELFSEDLTDWEETVEEISPGDVNSVPYPVSKVDWLDKIGPLSPKYSPYPSPDLEVQKERDSGGSWEVKRTLGGRGPGPLGTYVRPTRSFKMQVDGQFLRAQMVTNVEWYDHNHRELFSRWREPSIALDRARLGGSRTGQFWMSRPQ